MSDVFVIAVCDAIEAGDFDQHLVTLMLATRDRLELINPSRPPHGKLRRHQEWVWIGDGPDVPHWEFRENGAIAKKPRLYFLER